MIRVKGELRYLKKYIYQFKIKYLCHSDIMRSRMKSLTICDYPTKIKKNYTVNN